MCASRPRLGKRQFRLPESVADLFESAREAARQQNGGRWLDGGQCVERIAEHFVATYRVNLPKKRQTRSQRIIERDDGRCQVPGCSRKAAHAHHVRWKSRGGGNEDENHISLCAAHHLIAVHEHWVKVSGEAPDGLSWELGCRPGHEPLVRYELTP